MNPGDETRALRGDVATDQRERLLVEVIDQRGCLEQRFAAVAHVPGESLEQVLAALPDGGDRGRRRTGQHRQPCERPHPLFRQLFDGAEIGQFVEHGAHRNPAAIRADQGFEAAPPGEDRQRGRFAGRLQIVGVLVPAGEHPPRRALLPRRRGRVVGAVQDAAHHGAWQAGDDGDAGAADPAVFPPDAGRGGAHRAVADQVGEFGDGHAGVEQQLEQRIDDAHRRHGVGVLDKISGRRVFPGRFHRGGRAGARWRRTGPAARRAGGVRKIVAGRSMVRSSGGGYLPNYAPPPRGADSSKSGASAYKCVDAAIILRQWPMISFAGNAGRRSRP
jgi:hypothetical protein